ncbi:MAG: hypothetical protein AB7W37_00505 [Syntrophobacteraceae bacterium]|jgi:hypothetical protein
MAANGRFGKYGDLKRKSLLRRNRALAAAGFAGGPLVEAVRISKRKKEKGGKK